MVDSQNTTEEPALPKMSGVAPAWVVILSIASLDAAQQQAQRILPIRYEYQVDMVGHQTPSPHSNFRLLQIFAEKTKVGMPVFSGRKCFPPVHTTLGHMIGNPGQHTTRSSGHRRALYTEEENRADQAVPLFPEKNKIRVRHPSFFPQKDV